MMPDVAHHLRAAQANGGLLPGKEGGDHRPFSVERLTMVVRKAVGCQRQELR